MHEALFTTINDGRSLSANDALRHGERAAYAFLEAQSCGAEGAAPNALAWALVPLIEELVQSGGLASLRAPLGERTAASCSAQLVYFGFCAALSAAVGHGELSEGR